MALTRKFLSALGIEAEKIDEIIAAHTETTETLKHERDEAREKAAKLPEVQAELDALKAKPEDEYKAKYEEAKGKADEIKAEYEKFRADTEAEKALAAKKAAYEEVCKDAGLNETGVKRAMKYCDWAAVELDDKGKVVDAKNHIKALKEEWPDHVMSATTTGAATPNPPASGSVKTVTAEEIMKISDTAERQRAIAENHELFGI